MANANFAHKVGLVDVGLGSEIFLFASPGGSWTFSVKAHPSHSLTHSQIGASEILWYLPCREIHRIGMLTQSFTDKMDFVDTPPAV